MAVLHRLLLTFFWVLLVVVVIFSIFSVHKKLTTPTEIIEVVNTDNPISNTLEVDNGSEQALFDYKSLDIEYVPPIDYVFTFPNEVDNLYGVRFEDIPDDTEPPAWFSIFLSVVPGVTVTTDIVGIYFEDRKDRDRMKFIKVTMPCNEVYYLDPTNWPKENLMCRCGNPNHYVVKYGGTK